MTEKAYIASASICLICAVAAALRLSHFCARCRSEAERHHTLDRWYSSRWCHPFTDCSCRIRPNATRLPEWTRSNSKTWSDRIFPVICHLSHPRRLAKSRNS